MFILSETIFLPVRSIPLSMPLLQVRVGEVGGQAAGYNGGCFSPDGDVILAYSYFGGFHAWYLDKVAF